jgi:hypothetical protein
LEPDAGIALIFLPKFSLRCARELAEAVARAGAVGARAIDTY